MPNITTTPIEVEAEVKQYTLVGDDIYVKRYENNNIPAWYRNMIDNILNGNSTITNITDAYNYLNSLQQGYNLSITQLQDGQLVIDTRLESLKSSNDVALAGIADLWITKIDGASAQAIADTTVGAFFTGGHTISGAWFNERVSTYASAIQSNASNISVLAAVLGANTAEIERIDSVVVTLEGSLASATQLLTTQFEGLEVQLESVDQTYAGMFHQWDGVEDVAIGMFKLIGNVQYQYLGGALGENSDGWVRTDASASADADQALTWAAGASKLITSPNGIVTGWSFADGSNISSEFKIYADSLVIQGATAPIEYDNSAIVLPKTYEQSSAPTSGVLIGDTWIDTDDSYKVYTYTSTGWKATVGNKTFAQTTQPSSGMITNDIWYDTDDNNKPYYYNGSSWSAIRDGTIAIAQTAATAAQTTANTASTNATSALTQLTDIASDNILSPVEKSTVIADYAVITAEQSGIDAQATSYAITTEKTAYDTAVTALTTYLNTLTAPVAWNVSTGNTTIVAATFRSKFSDVYTTRQTLLNAISARAKLLADTAQSTANSAYNEAIARVLPAGVAAAINNNTTTISGSKITTGTVYAAQIAVDALDGKSAAFSGTRVYGDGVGYSVTANNGLHSQNTGYGVVGKSTGKAGGFFYTTSAGTPGLVGTNTAGGVAIQGVTSAGGWGLYTAQRAYVGAGYPFTGAHFTFIKEEPVIGDIIIGYDAIGLKVEQSFVYAEVATISEDKRVFGVASYANDDIEVAALNLGDFSIEVNGIREIKPEYVDFIKQLKADGFHLGSVNSIGEGMLNVCDESGNIEVGDYICSSTIKGKGMKQNDDILHNYTVAKALESVDWSIETSNTKMIACTYHCG